MADPFVGEIRMFAGNFAPQNWAFCNGQLLPIEGYDALFSLLGTTYGGNGTTTFALPNLNGRFAIHQGQGAGLSPRVIGGQAGEQEVTLQIQQLPIHSHAANCSTKGTTANPKGNFWATDPGGNIAPYSTAAPNGQMAPLAAGPTGGQSHNNQQPYMAVNYIISLYGIYPSQS
ncbi:MAG: phage tail protein [Acidobacteriaceae bacterium]|nr:phage tail protein [Acidobacteriaceae bacterium]